MAMLPNPLTFSSIEDPAAPVPKLRHCLMCSNEFPSAWAGERLCSRCKGTSAWRRGVSASQLRGGGRRSRHSSDG